MKINARIIFITFLVVVIVSVSSSLVYYSITNAILESRNSKNILNSANDFVFFLETSIDKATEDFQKYFLHGGNGKQIDIDSTNVDVVFTVASGNQLNLISKKSNVFLNERFVTFQDFIKDNPYLILKYSKDSEDRTLFYGIVINESFLNEAAKKIRADVALIVDNIPYAFSNSAENSKFIPNLISSQNELQFLNNFDISVATIESADFLAVKYEPKYIISSNSKLSFLVFSYFTDIYFFTDTMKIIIPVVLMTGTILAMIFTLLFTTKFRKQISLLTEAADITAKGNLDYRVPIITKDEIGELGSTFNKMISEIGATEKIEKEYAEFITIINKNKSLSNLSEAVLKEILEVTEFKFGAIYLVEQSCIKTLAAIGLSNDYTDSSEKQQIYNNVMNNREVIEMRFERNYPVIRSSLVEIQIRYLLIMPVISGNEIIGIIEIASESEPKDSPREKLNRIIDQLAIGLRNAVSYEKMSNLVEELKQLNEDYHNQNLQMKEKNEELVKLHKELQLKAQELEEEKRKAVELSHVKSQFLASMSHELKTPLNSIIGLSELTERDSSTLAKTRDRVKIVLRNSKKLLSMISNILEFSKIESGKYELNEQKFLITELLGDIYSSSEILANEKQLNLSVKLNYTKNLLIETDRVKLDHIILNLVSNAIKFTDKGSVSVIAEKTGETDLAIHISDTGIGISEENKAKIFDEFQQLESGNNRKYSGVGLGLAICTRYAKLLNGRLSVHSVEDKGSTFTLYLSDIIVDEIDYLVNEPFEIFSNAIPEQSKRQLVLDASDTDTETSKPAAPGKKLPKILIVDDDKDTLYTVGEILQSLGFELHFATNGIECLERLDLLTPDLVLLDIMMPEMDGFETINKIRANKNFSELTVYALTAHAMLDDKYIIEESGFDDLITKPLDSTTLLTKVKQAIINRKKNPS